MDDKTFASAVLEASRLNNLHVEKLIKKQTWTNRFLLLLVITIPLTTWFDNRGFLTIFISNNGWVKILLYTLFVAAIATIVVLNKARFAKK